MTLDIPWRDLAEIFTLISAFAAFWRSIHNGSQISKLNVEINSRMTQLLTTVTSAARAEGVLAGRKAVHEENSTIDH